MKKLGILFLGLLLIAACHQKEQVEVTNTLDTVKEKPLKERIANHIQNELASGEQHDSIALDFTFGMSKMDVYKHTKALHKKKKMYPIQKSKKVREYVYDLRLRKSGKTRTFFEAFYYDNPTSKKEELYKIECLPKIDISKTEPISMVEEIKIIYEMEYGTADFVIPSMGDENCKTYLWLNGNQKIELGCLNDKVFMYYTDIPVERLAAKASDL